MAEWLEPKRFTRSIEKGAGFRAFFHVHWDQIRRFMWTERDNRLVREFRFKDFQEAFTFMTRVAFLAESHAHHPTMVNTFSYVRIELHTHDAGGVVTRKDHELAQDIDALLQ